MTVDAWLTVTINDEKVIAGRLSDPFGMNGTLAGSYKGHEVTSVCSGFKRDLDYQ